MGYNCLESFVGGLQTDVFDASSIARVRMYRTWGEVVRGLQKNATEGIANRS